MSKLQYDIVVSPPNYSLVRIMPYYKIIKFNQIIKIKTPKKEFHIKSPYQRHDVVAQSTTEQRLDQFLELGRHLLQLRD